MPRDCVRWPWQSARAARAALPEMEPFIPKPPDRAPAAMQLLLAAADVLQAEGVVKRIDRRWLQHNLVPSSHPKAGQK